MDRRYQAFVSSTYEDLREERSVVIKSLLRTDCFPSGMELFPATDDDQWSLIQSVIDECDFFVVIVAGRYGSLLPDGRSYTQREYEYAIENGKPVLGFIRSDTQDLPVAMCASTDRERKQLESFRKLVMTRTCRFWKTPGELAASVMTGILHLRKTRAKLDSAGWVRAGQIVDVTANQEIVRLRRRIEELEQEIVSSNGKKLEGTFNPSKVRCSRQRVCYTPPLFFSQRS